MTPGGRPGPGNFDDPGRVRLTEMEICSRCRQLGQQKRN
jgi:hypothetical protein